MLPSLLILSVSLQLAWTCLPMKPAEDMHCPSVPLASAVDGYAVNGLVKTIVDGAEVYSCAPPDKADLIEVDGTKITTYPGGKISCNPNSGIFVKDNLAVNQKTYNCGKQVSCQGECATSYKDVYFDNGQTNIGLPDTLNPSCVYTCPTDFFVLVNKMSRHDRALCNMITGEFTADTVDGEMLSKTNQFECQGCNCPNDPTVINDGQRGLCPQGKLCVKPIKTEACEAFCPADSKAVYKDKDGKTQTSSSVKCLGTDWIVEGYDKTAGITCQFDDGKGYTEEQPTDGAQCTKLGILTACTKCDPTQIIYVGDGNEGYSVMCKMGTLVTDMAGPEDDDLKQTCLYGTPLTIMEVNCLNDDTQVPLCIMDVDLTIVSWNCSFGVCRVMCKEAGKMISYSTGSGAGKEEYLKCLFGDLMNQNAESVTKNSIACVA